MKKILFLPILVFGIGNVHAQESTSIEAEGNLESLTPCGCVEISEVTNDQTPADIYVGIAMCIELKDFEKAAKLFAIAAVYGKFDSFRVEDRTAHQAMLVLQQNVFFNLSEADKENLLSSLNKILEKKSDELLKVCTAIQMVGIPKYYPKYMIQHGMQAIIEGDGNGLVDEFNSEEAWSLALKNYLHCGE